MKTVRRVKSAQELWATSTQGKWRRCGGGFQAKYVAIHSDTKGYIVFGMADSSEDLEHHRPIKAPSDKEQRSNAKLIERMHDSWMVGVNAATAAIKSGDLSSKVHKQLEEFLALAGGVDLGTFLASAYEVQEDKSRRECNDAP